MSIKFLEFSIVVTFLAFLMEFYRIKKLENFSIKNNKNFIKGFFDIILCYYALKLNFGYMYYTLVFYYCVRITAFKAKIIFINFYYLFYTKTKFLYERKLDRFKHKIFYLSKDKRIFIFCHVFFLILLYLYVNIIIYVVFILIIADVNFLKFNYHFDEAYINKNNDYDIILFKSGKKKLLKYLKDLAQTQTDIIFSKHWNEKKSIVLIWGKDFKYKKKMVNQMYKNGCL